MREPTPTPYDLSFQIAGIPIRVHPFFWLVGLILGFRGGDLVELLIWLGVFFVSILIHELGHAAAIRYYGWEPWIILYGFGGLAGYQPHYTPDRRSYAQQGNTPAGQIIIALAGPMAGLAFAGSVIAGLLVANQSLEFPLVVWEGWVTIGRGPPVESPRALQLIGSLLWINIVWSIINLFPVFPLDGGRVARELFLLFSPQEGARNAYILSMITAAALAVYGLTQLGSFFMAILFALLCVESYQALQYLQGRRW